MWAKISTGAYVPLEGKGFTVNSYPVKGQKKELYEIIAVGHLESSPFATAGFTFILANEIQTKEEAQKILDLLIERIQLAHIQFRGFYNCKVCDMGELIKSYIKEEKEK